MRSEVVLCTRNRPADVARFLDSWREQRPRPPLLVVDSSDGDETGQLVSLFALLHDVDARHLRAERGLTRQRMVGVHALRPETEVVHFVDDDVALEAGYFAAVESQLKEPGILGAGGLITNLEPHNPWWLRRLFLLDSKRPAVVLPSGINVLTFSAEDPVEAQWLSGCAMSYRREILEMLTFDTRMEGYSLGEDVDFSFRVHELGRLVVTPEARLAHLCSPVERHARHALARMEAVHRHDWVREMRGRGVWPIAFWWSLLGAILINGGKGLLRAQRDPLRRALALIAAGFDIFLRPVPVGPRVDRKAA